MHLFSGAPVNDPNHPDFVPSVFMFSLLRKSTPNKLSKFEGLEKRRCILETISEENRQTEEKENLIRTEAADALLDLSQSDPKVTDIGMNIYIFGFGC